MIRKHDQQYTISRCRIRSGQLR